MPQIKFTVGSDLTSFFEKTKQQANQLSNSLIADAQKESSAAKMQIKLIEEQISLMQKKNRLSSQINGISGTLGASDRISNIDNRDDLITRLRRANNKRHNDKEITTGEFLENNQRIGLLSKRNTVDNISSESKEFTRKQAEAFKMQELQTKLVRENTDAVKAAAKENVKAIQSGDKKIEDIISEAKTPQEKLAASLAKEEVEGKKGKSDAELSKLVGGILGVGAITSLIGNIGKLTQTRSGFDLIAQSQQTMGSVIGTALGGIIGGGVGAIPGAGAGAAAGGAIGSALGGVKGGVDQRIIEAQMRYLDSQNRYRATTGGDLSSSGIGDFSQYGLSKQQDIESAREMARLTGSSKNARMLAEQSYFADKGYGVDRGTSNSLIENQRSTNRGDIDLANTIGGVLEKGKNTYFKNGDNSFLNEFMIKYSTLTKELIKNTNTVASGTTYDILSKFNAVGGQFSTQDPRSMGLISTINSSLANPGNDFAKAADFMALRQVNPEMDWESTMEEMQKGLGSSKYLSSVLKQLKSAGGNKGQQIRNIAERFGLQNNFAAARSIYENEDDLIKNNISLDDVYKKTDLSGKAKEFTTPEQSNAANVANAVLSDWSTAVKAMQDAFTTAMQDVANGMELVKNSDGSTSMKFNPRKAQTATQAKRDATYGTSFEVKGAP